MNINKVFNHKILHDIFFYKFTNLDTLNCIMCLTVTIPSQNQNITLLVNFSYKNLLINNILIQSTLMSIVKHINDTQLKTLPEFKPGYTVRVHQKIREGGKERTQIFEGLVIARKGSSLRKDDVISLGKRSWIGARGVNFS